MSRLIDPIEFPNETQLRQPNLIVLIVVVIVTAVLLFAITGVIFCLVCSFRQKTLLISKSRKAVKYEVAENTKESSRKLASAQKYLRDAAGDSTVVSLASLSQHKPPTKPVKKQKNKRSDKPRINLTDASVQVGEGTLEHDKLSDDNQPPPYHHPIDVEDTDFLLHSRAQRTIPVAQTRTDRTPPPVYRYPAHLLN